MIRGFRWGAAVLALLVLTLAAGCVRPLKEQVVGTWKETRGNWQLSLLKDGTFTSSGAPGELFGSAAGSAVPPGGGSVGDQLRGLVSAVVNSVRINGSYTTPDEKTLKLQPQGVAGVLGPQVWPVHVTGRRLIADVNGTRTEFTRTD